MSSASTSFVRTSSIVQLLLETNSSDVGVSGELISTLIVCVPSVIHPPFAINSSNAKINGIFCLCKSLNAAIVARNNMQSIWERGQCLPRALKYAKTTGAVNEAHHDGVGCEPIFRKLIVGQHWRSLRSYHVKEVA